MTNLFLNGKLWILLKARTFSFFQNKMAKRVGGLGRDNRFEDFSLSAQKRVGWIPQPASLLMLVMIRMNTEGASMIDLHAQLKGFWRKCTKVGDVF